MNNDQLISQLNGPSRVLAEELFRRLPAWIDYAAVVGRSFPPRWEPGSLTVHVPSPVAGRNHWLEVTVEGNTFATYYNFSDPIFLGRGCSSSALEKSERRQLKRSTGWLTGLLGKTTTDKSQCVSGQTGLRLSRHWARNSAFSRRASDNKG